MMYHCITLHAGLLSCAGRLVWLGTRPATCIAAAGCWNKQVGPWSFLSGQFVLGQLRGLHHNLAQEGCTVDGFLEKHPASHGPGPRFTQNIEAVLINWQHDSFLDTTKTCKRPRHLQHSIRMVSIAMFYRPFHCFDLLPPGRLQLFSTQAEHNVAPLKPPRVPTRHTSGAVHWPWRLRCKLVLSMMSYVINALFQNSLHHWKSSTCAALYSVDESRFEQIEARSRAKHSRVKAVSRATR